MDDLFARLSRGTFSGIDPNATVHEMAIGGANIQPTGWYGQHTYSSSVGQTNLLDDPTLDSAPASGGNLTGSKVTFGKWAGHYVVNSGSTYTPVGIIRKYERGDTTSNPFSSGVISGTITQSGAGSDMNIYSYPDADLSPTALPVLDWMVGAVKLFRTDALATNITTYTATLELLQDGSVVASSDTHDLTADATYAVVPLKVAYQASAATFRASAWRWRLNIHLVTSALPVGVIKTRWGEPQLHFNYSPDPLPFAPLAATWVPSILSRGIFVTNELTGGSLSSNTNDWDPGISTIYSILSVNPSTPINLTGLVGGATGRLLALVNPQPSTVTLVHESASSSASNRFACAGASNVSLTQYMTRWLLYRSGRWYVMG